MQQPHGENQLNVIPSSSANNEILTKKHICETLNTATSEKMSNNNNDCELPRNNGILEKDILTSILFSDHDLKAMLTEAAGKADEGSFIFVARCDNGQILFVSSTINNILNIRQEEWLNVNLFTQIHPGDEEKVKEQLIILNSEIDGGNDDAKKNDEVKKGVDEGDDNGTNDECIGMISGNKEQEKSVGRRVFNCRVKCRPNKQPSTLVNNNENSDMNSDRNTSNYKESTGGQNYLTIQCSGLIRKWPSSLISTQVNDEPSDQQLNEDESHVHCLVAMARIKQQPINQSPPPIQSQSAFNQRLLSSTQQLLSPSTPVMTNTFNRIKQFTTKHTINGNFIYVDQRITDALGYNTAELLDKCFFDYFYHDDCKFIKETFKFIPSLKGKPMTVTYRYWSKVVSYWIWLRIVIYANSNRAAVNYIICDCTVLPNEVTADNINNSTINYSSAVSSAGCIASSTNRKPFNSNYSNRFNHFQQHAHYNHNNNNNHKAAMHRHQYHKHQQHADNLTSSIHTDQPHQLTDAIFASNNGYLNNDQSSSMCHPFQFQRAHQEQHPRTMMPPPPPPPSSSSSQLDMYNSTCNNMLQIDSYLAGRRLAAGNLSDENLLIPPSSQSSWGTAQISNTFPSASTEWSNVQSTSELLPPTSNSANWSFLFNNGVNKTNGSNWSSYLPAGNSNTDVNSVEQQLDFWATLDDVNSSSIWPTSDNCNNNEALVYNCNNQQLSNSLLPANMDVNSFRQKSNWLTENVDNFENLSQVFYNNDTTSSAGVNNLTRSNIYNELLNSGITSANEQENQSNFYSELEMANIWSQMEREQQIQLQQLIINDNYSSSGENNSFESLGLNNLIMPAQSQQTVAAMIGANNKNVGEEDSGHDFQEWKLNEEMVNNMYNMYNMAGKPESGQQQVTSGGLATAPRAMKPSSSLLFTTNHLQSPNGNTIILPHSPRLSPTGNSHNSNILSRLPDLIEQVLHVDQTYNKHMITATDTATTPTMTANSNTDINQPTILISQPISKTTPNGSCSTMIPNVPINSTPPTI